MSGINISDWAHEMIHGVGGLKDFEHYDPVSHLKKPPLVGLSDAWPTPATRAAILSWLR